LKILKKKIFLKEKEELKFLKMLENRIGNKYYLKNYFFFFLILIHLFKINHLL
jgi:hypothetical protein